MPSSNSEKAPYSFGKMVEFINNNFVIVLLLGLALVAGAVGGSLLTENKMLKAGTVPTRVADTQPDAAAQAQPTQPDGPTEDTLAKMPAVGDEDHINGNKDAQVVLVEYSDFECPFCGRFHPTMQQVLKDYGDKVAWVFRQYPLPFHPQAQPAAETSECVAKLGGNDAFWKYADSVFAANGKAGTITQADIDAGVTASGVDQAAVKKCVDSGEMAQKVKDQMNAGSQAGIQGTPGTIVTTADGKFEMINGALPYEQVKAVLDKYVQ